MTLLVAMLLGLAVLLAPGGAERGCRGVPERRRHRGAAHGSASGWAGAEGDVPRAPGAGREGARATRDTAPDALGADPDPSEPGDGPRRRPELTYDDVAECADLLAIALAGGSDLLTALEVVSEAVTGEPRRQLRVVSAASRWGVPPAQAWRLVSPAWSQVASAFAVAGRAGVAPTGLLAEAASSVRRGQARRAAVRAGALSARIALPLGLAFLPGFVLTTVVPVVIGLARSVLSP